MSLKFEILLAITILVASNGFTKTQAQCPAIKAMSTFNVSQFAGRWYQIKKFRTLFDGLSGNCASVNITVNNSNNVTIAVTTPLAVLKNWLTLQANGVFDWKFSAGIGKLQC